MNNIELANKRTYITDNLFIFSTNIWEYDIKQANINALLSMNRISVDEYNYLSKLPKQLREIEIGNRIKEDKSLQQDIYEAIDKAKLEFLSQNKIEPYNVIRIANDAIYCIAPYPVAFKDFYIGNHLMSFVLKNHFTSFLKLCKLYLFFNNGEDGYDIDVKGIGDSKIYLHAPFLEFICDIINAKEKGAKDIAISKYMTFYENYINRQLPIEYYREFNSASIYKISSEYSSFSIIDGNNININYIDISYNLNVLRQLYSYILTN